MPSSKHDINSEIIGMKFHYPTNHWSMKISLKTHYYEKHAITKYNIIFGLKKNTKHTITKNTLLPNTLFRKTLL